MIDSLLKKLLKLSNSIRQKELSKLYNKAKADIHNVDLIKKLVSYSKESLDIQNTNWKNNWEISEIKPMLYYVWFNK